MVNLYIIRFEYNKFPYRKISGVLEPLIPPEFINSEAQNGLSL